ncbi:MAG: outer membrane beta-barrel protein [Ignavibacteriae bacterium]|nr:outer membrane beta-barrel protein [Ignavibacteriota bacterium]
MKRFVAIVVAVMSFSTLASGQLKFGGGPHLSLAFSAFPKPVNEVYGFGFGFGAHGDMSIIKYIALRLNFDYHIFSSDKEKIKAAAGVSQVQGLEISGLNASIVGITINGLGKLPTGSMITPYGILGLGIHILSVSDGQATIQGQNIPIQLGLGSETKFGLNFGAGAEFAIGMFKVYGDIKYVLILTSGNSTGIIPITFGVTFGG